MKSVLFFLILTTFSICAVADTAKCPAGQKLQGNLCVLQSEGDAACDSGYVLTQYGCLPQGACPEGQGMYNKNTCVPAVSVEQFYKLDENQQTYGYTYWFFNY